jgi:protein-tyrosine phosphatase
MLDFHSHLIPGIDDGSKDIGMSMGMLGMWKEQGFGHICATPHFYADMMRPEHFLEKRNEAYQSLLAAINAAPGGAASYPVIIPGAEVHYFRGMSSCEGIFSLCLKNTKLLLVEMPFHKWSDYMIREIAELTSIGLIPVAAHIERYLSIQGAETIDKLLDTGILVQCNAEFFLSARTRRKALRIISSGTVDFLGSDAHNLTTRAPNLGEAVGFITKKLGAESLRHIEKNSALILDAQRITLQGGVA